MSAANIASGNINGLMSKDEVRASWGEPSRVFPATQARDEMWIYNEGSSSTTILFSADGRVSVPPKREYR